MIFNPDFFIVGGFCISGLLTSFVMYYLGNKVPLWKNAIYSLAFFIICICISIHFHDQMENKLKSLTQDVYIKYKYNADVRVSRHRYETNYYFTVVFNDNCVGDIKVDQDTYNSFNKGSYIKYTPSYYVYSTYLKNGCLDTKLYIDDKYNAKVLYKRIQQDNNGKYSYKMGFKYPNGCIYEKDVPMRNYQNIPQGAIIRSSSNIKYDYDSVKSKQCN